MARCGGSTQPEGTELLGLPSTRSLAVGSPNLLWWWSSQSGIRELGALVCSKQQVSAGADSPPRALLIVLNLVVLTCAPMPALGALSLATGTALGSLQCSPSTLLQGKWDNNGKFLRFQGVCATPTHLSFSPPSAQSSL